MQFPKRFFLALIILTIILGGCQAGTDSPGTSIELDEKPARVIISLVFTGEEGNNQADFIQLFNAGTEIADLSGCSLWYQLKDGDEELLVATWDETTLVPPLGYYALGLEGQDFAVQPDLSFNQPLVPSRGGLSLRSENQVLDQVSWGSGPLGMAEGRPGPAIPPGSALTRQTEQAGSVYQDNDDNKGDFGLTDDPAFKNTGSPLEHPGASSLQFSVDFPDLVKPGEQVQVGFEILNHTGIDLQDIRFQIDLPDNFIFESGDADPHLAGRTLSGSLPSLEDGEVFEGSLNLRADYTFSSFELRNSYLQAGNWPLPAFNGPIYGEIGGGAIPIATARELVDREVVVQGTSTMYVGGFYAGSGAKFYLEDDSGGVQVYVAGAGSSLIVPLGSTVQVRGQIQVYRDSIELVPSSQDQVQILQPGGEESYREPETVAIESLNTNPEDYPGQLITVEGRIGRVEEFSYSYEIDLFDPQGSLVTIYLDKETGVTIEEIESDQSYQITGIYELYDGNWRLYPRLQSDLERVYDPGLYVEAQPPTSALLEEPFQVRFLVTNHDIRSDQQVILRAVVDPQLEILEISEGGTLEGRNIVWEIPRLAGNQAIQPGFEARFSGDPDYVSFKDFTVQSVNWPEPVGGFPSYTFAGESVPIWAIQGSGERSPYTRQQLTTIGVVTGIFPELDGFWIQETQSDSDPATSPGIFINSGPNLPEISPGDLVSVAGLVRESFQQTELEISSAAAVEVLGTEPIPDPVELYPPADDLASARYFESLEGTLVALGEPAVVVGPSTRYGEYTVVLEDTGLSRSWQDQPHGMLIHIDDGSSLTHESGDTLPYSLSVGDQVEGISGPLAFTYGTYKIEPIESYDTATQPPALDPLPEAGEGYLRIMTWNAENAFDFVVPHPSDPDLPTVSEYKRDIKKIGLTIEAAGFPTVVALQEIENIDVLADIAAEPSLAGYDYQPLLIEGTDSRGIDVGYLIRGDQAIVQDVVQYPAPGNITSRPPLLVEIQPVGREDTFYLLNNHFTSMSGGEEATQPRRVAQAAWNLEIAQELLNGDPQAYLAVLGDLNSYYDSPPLLTLQDGGLTNLFDTLAPEERYTYIYEGNSQVLDHILVNENLRGILTAVDVLHSNADYPLPSSADTSLFHKSDHDPVIATFVLP